MGTRDVRIDTRLNKAIWTQGVRGVPFRMRIRLARLRTASTSCTPSSPTSRWPREGSRACRRRMWKPPQIEIYLLHYDDFVEPIKCQKIEKKKSQSVVVSTFSVCRPLNPPLATWTWVTRVYSLWMLSSSSFLSLARRILILKGTPLTPWVQIALLSLVSIRTSLVPICFSANFLISLTALGALYLKPIPWRRLWRLIVYSLVTTSPIVPVFSLRTIFFNFSLVEVNQAILA